jgi:uncharacterized protein involved in type VI secretion and phage assembly
MNDLSALWAQASHHFASDKRLFWLQGKHDLSDLAVDRWRLRETLSCDPELLVDGLHLDAHLDIDAWVMQPVTLWTARSDGTRVARSGLITEVRTLDTNGGFARYRLVVHSWLWLLTQSERSRLRTHETVLSILENRVFAPYHGLAHWRLTPDVEPFLADVPARLQCTQHRETDYDFMRRLLASEGLGFYIEEDPTAPHGHRLVVFADSYALPEDATSASPLGGRGIRFHGARAVEEQDAIQVLGCSLGLSDAHTTTLSWDYAAKRSYASTVPGYPGVAGPNAPRLENYVLPQRVYRSSAKATDQRASAQGNLAGGNSPAWHGASPLESGHGNAAALTGFKTKEFGSHRHNQLLLDDTSRRLCVHLASMEAWTALSLGHLIHRQDNYRGSFRGQGLELRTDAYGAVRSSRGVLISSFGTRNAEPSQDNAPGISLAKQAAAQAKAFNQAAQTHETVKFATAIGSHQANASTLSEKEAPLPAMAKVIGGMVDAHSLEQALTDAANQVTATGPNKVPHSAAPVVTVIGKAGIANIASQDQHWAAGETVSVQAGQDINLAAGEQLKLHTGQAIGVLAGAIKAGAGSAGTGITLVAAEGPINVQAQADTLQVAAKDDVVIISVNDLVELAAGRSIELCVTGGASLTLQESGIITKAQTITIEAGTKSFIGPATMSYPLPAMPRSVCVDCLAQRAQSRAALVPTS